MAERAEACQAIKSRIEAINNTHDSKIERCIDLLAELHSRAGFILSEPKFFKTIVIKMDDEFLFYDRLKPLIYDLSSVLREKIHELPPILSDHHDIIDKLFTMFARLAPETQFPDGSDPLFAQF